MARSMGKGGLEIFGYIQDLTGRLLVHQGLELLSQENPYNLRKNSVTIFQALELSVFNIVLAKPLLCREALHPSFLLIKQIM